MRTSGFQEPMLQALGTTFAGLFLVLMIVAAAPAPRHPAAGVLLEVMRTGTPESFCSRDGTLFAGVKADGSVWLNAERLDSGQVAPVVAEIVKNRPWIGIFFFPSDDASMQQVVEAATNLKADAPGLRLGPVTGRVFDSPCMVWPHSLRADIP